METILLLSVILSTPFLLYWSLPAPHCPFTNGEEIIDIFSIKAETEPSDLTAN